ncbi:MAG: long-chain-fatty-acid--CoA ligase [Nitrospinaceae bacterium]|nr:long-chain-fatty-acid--CoA ligase [Nitrospinaceae bacterium]MBT4432044.1 long-chain-fatty-acid--CoA ligase [Nitrospinaceae bacterium]MBT5947381.1 long-chain-fatty-acid--CoA ligase [Nitrospinaceae bacterium]MBT6396058.1 long-chain-fatty-acid--CoA ligase [Nitrospinaceae bacterium]
MPQSEKPPRNFRAPLKYPGYPYHGLLRQALDHLSNKIAIVDGERELTFGELESRSNACARGLTHLGIQKGDRVALLVPNSIEFEVAFFAGSKTGAILTSLNPAYKEEEVRYQLEDSGAKIVIVHESLLPTILSVRDKLPNLKNIIVTEGKAPPDCIGFDEWIAGEVDTQPDEPTIDQANDLIALPYSSGTTGRPKGVMLTHRNLVRNYHQFVDNHKISERDGALNFLPLYHIYGTLIMGGLILAGGKQVLMRRFDVEESLELVERHQLTLFYTVPPALLDIVHHPNTESYDLSSLRYIMSGAAPLPSEIRRLTQEKTGCLTFMGYGLTETSPLTHMNPIDEEMVKENSIGPPVSDLEQKVVDLETGERDMPLGEIGELALKGPQVMKGYWNAPEETARVLRDGWFLTGDIVRIDEDGYVYIVDRLKEMIKYKGFSVAPAELESLLHQHPQVADAAVIPKADDEAGEIPKAFIVLKDGEKAEPEAIIEFVRGKVAGFKQIREIEFIDRIPKSRSGKILRRVLRDKH